MLICRPWVLSCFFRTWTSIHPLKDLSLINLNIITTPNTKRATPAHHLLGIWLFCSFYQCRLSASMVWAFISAIGQRRPRHFNVGGMEIVGWCFRGVSILLDTSGLFFSSLRCDGLTKKRHAETTQENVHSHAIVANNSRASITCANILRRSMGTSKSRMSA